MDAFAVFAPLIGFLIAFLFGKQIGHRGAQIVTCAGIILAACLSVGLFFDVVLGQSPRTVSLMTWMASGDFVVDWALRFDTLSVVMMNVVTIVSACVHVYSVGYMSHDPARARFMSYLSLFSFAMLMLVTSDNLLQLFFGWEGVGVASYLLIGFWNHKDSANAAAIKAFLVNRVGDLGLALGVMAIFILFGSVQFDTIFAAAEEVAGRDIDFLGFTFNGLTVACLLLFMGAMGKSAQLGLHTWLPDAMEGPTPVSALIHAATMVTAGVFLLARMSPVFEYAPTVLMVVTLVGAATALVAATIGLTQHDIKRVIAYSTMSQLGYMFFALGVSAYAAAIFHLMTHAFFKALLFLGAGSVIHALHDEQDMRNMGGVWRKIPVTYALMWIGSLALAGIPFFAGYFSKDIMLESAFADESWFGNLAYWIGIAAAVMTAFYSGRLLFLTFHGKPRMDAHTFDHAHESPPVMLLPLLVLASGAILAGYAFYAPFVGGGDHHAAQGEEVALHEAEENHAEDEAASEEAAAESVAPDAAADEPAAAHEAVAEHEDSHADVWRREGFWGDSLFVRADNDTIAAAHDVPKWVKLLPTGAGALGLVLALLYYIVHAPLAPMTARLFKPLYLLFFHKWYFDELYHALFVRPAVWLGGLFSRGDRKVIDRFGPDGAAWLAGSGGGGFSRLQSGYVFHYAFVMMVGVIALIGWLIWRIYG